MSKFATLRQGPADTGSSVDNLAVDGSWQKSLSGATFYFTRVNQLSKSEDDEVYETVYAFRTCKEALDNNILANRASIVTKGQLYIGFVTKMSVNHVEGLLNEVETKIGIPASERTQILPVFNCPNVYIAKAPAYWAKSMTCSSAYTWMIRTSIRLNEHIKTFSDLKKNDQRQESGYLIQNWLPKVERLMEVGTDLDFVALDFTSRSRGAVATYVTDINKRKHAEVKQ